MQNSIPVTALYGVGIRGSILFSVPAILELCLLQAVYCIQIALAEAKGWSSSAKWRRLCNRYPEHEKSNWHMECYVAWRIFERRLSLHDSIENLLEASIKVESEKWHSI